MEFCFRQNFIWTWNDRTICKLPEESSRSLRLWYTGRRYLWDFLDLKSGNIWNLWSTNGSRWSVQDNRWKENETVHLRMTGWSLQALSLVQQSITDLKNAGHGACGLHVPPVVRNRKFLVYAHLGVEAFQVFQEWRRRTFWALDQQRKQVNGCQDGSSHETTRPQEQKKIEMLGFSMALI